MSTPISNLINYKNQIYKLASVKTTDVLTVLRMAETGLALCLAKDSMLQKTCRQKLENELTARLNTLALQAKTILNFHSVESRANDNSIGSFCLEEFSAKMRLEYNVVRCMQTGNGHNDFTWYLGKKSAIWDTTKVRDEKTVRAEEVAAWFVQLLDIKVKYRHDETAAYKLLAELKRQGTPGVGNDIVFFSSVILNIVAMDENTVYVHLLYVDPKRRNEHLASKVLRLLVAWADYYCCDILGTALPVPGKAVVFPFSANAKIEDRNYLVIEKLISFYAQFGFVLSKEPSEEGISIARKAKNCRKKRF